LNVILKVTLITSGANSHRLRQLQIKCKLNAFVLPKVRIIEVTMQTSCFVLRKIGMYRFMKCYTKSF